jgi:hypothetical protein
MREKKCINCNTSGPILDTGHCGFCGHNIWTDMMVQELLISSGVLVSGKSDDGKGVA